MRGDLHAIPSSARDEAWYREDYDTAFTALLRSAIDYVRRHRDIFSRDLNGSEPQNSSALVIGSLRE